MADIRHRVGISAPAAKVYQAVATKDGLAGWWTRDVRGDAGQLGAGQDLTRQSVSKHLAVLDAANLVTTVRREKLHYLTAAPISDIAGRWVDRSSAARARCRT